MLDTSGQVPGSSRAASRTVPDSESRIRQCPSHRVIPVRSMNYFGASARHLRQPFGVWSSFPNPSHLAPLRTWFTSPDKPAGRIQILTCHHFAVLGGIGVLPSSSPFIIHSCYSHWKGSRSCSATPTSSLPSIPPTTSAGRVPSLRRVFFPLLGRIPVLPRECFISAE